MLEKQGTKKRKDRVNNKKNTEYPDHRELIIRLKRVEGQVTGIQNMILNNRYCVDILIQFQAVSSALREIEKRIFEKHLKGCVKNALSSNDLIESDNKTRELIKLIFGRLKSG